MTESTSANAASENKARALSVFRALLRAPSVIALLIANLLPVYGVVMLGWDLFNLLLVYWMETGIIGVFAILNIAMVSGFQALFLVPFFIVHFSGFMLGHMLFLLMLFGKSPGDDLTAAPVYIWNMITGNALFIALAGLAVSHAIAFAIYRVLPWLARLRAGEMKSTEDETGSIMAAPYARVIVMHLTILFGAALATVFGSKLALLLLLIGLKTISDLWSLLRRPVPKPIIS